MTAALEMSKTTFLVETFQVEDSPFKNIFKDKGFSLLYLDLERKFLNDYTHYIITVRKVRIRK